MVHNKRLILVSQFVDNFGSGFSRIALIILVTNWFHNALYVGVLSFFLFVPGILLAAPIGRYVDRRQRLKPLLMQTSLAAAGAVFFLFLCVYLNWRIYSLLVLSAVVYDIFTEFFDPIVTKLTVHLFDVPVYKQINAAISTARTSASLFAGILVTALSTIIPIYWLFLFDFMSYLIVCVCLIGLNEGTADYHSGSQLDVTFTSATWNSFGFVKQLLDQFPAMLPVLVTALLFNILLAPNAVYFTQIATTVYHDSNLTGIMDSMFSVGFLLGSILYRWLENHVKVHTFIQIAIIQVPIAFLAFSQSRHILGCLLGLLLLGGALPDFNISCKTILQERIPESDLATVSNSYYALINLSQPVGLLGIPILISGMGIQQFSLLAGVTYLLVTLVIIGTRKISVQLD